MNKTFVVASLACCLLSGNVLAADTGLYGSTASGESPAVHRTFLKLDTNKDGYIERNEAKTNASLSKDFAKVAKNGKLSESEFSAWEVEQGTTAGGMTKARHENMPAGPMDNPKTGGGTK